MKTTEFKVLIHEPEFGSSTSAVLTADNYGRILFAQDTSTLETNYLWDGWGWIGGIESLVGLYIDDIKVVLDNRFREFVDEYRSPYAIIMNKNTSVIL